jgi:hypothetical protein
MGADTSPTSLIVHLWIYTAPGSCLRNTTDSLPYAMNLLSNCRSGTDEFRTVAPRRAVAVRLDSMKKSPKNRIVGVFPQVYNIQNHWVYEIFLSSGEEMEMPTPSGHLERAGPEIEVSPF